ncbi:metal-dependent hydrolase [Penicillium cinerascens]|uniref:Metal-dependent hydrolase n=1 Tax=Penicillium cinerascens TaxID=70096 RepID=A0A9W9NB73_9EURO|nr:metal-dependent hydrolase [Penicillium cinerascens]KAJ5216642.1 metal-dependent hydrolase [Penicillium cinerascens]
MLPLIALEEHFVSSKVREAERVDHYATFPPHIVTKLQSLGNERIQDLNEGNVSLQVISHGPGVRSTALCITANDELASAISKNPTRMAGFAMLPMDDPAAAAKELERCVRDLHYVGALVDSHVNGHFYDEKRFWTVFEKAQELNVPVYIHPSFPADDMAEHYKGDYDDSIALALSAFGWGWHSETALSILKLFASGLFDSFPKVKILIGHMGEMLPFQLERVILTSERWGRRRGLREVWTENVWITTSGMFALPPLACLLQTTSIDHVLYSVDYPFSTNEKGLEFFREVEKSGLIPGKDLEKFAFRNAESLLGVEARVFLEN